MLTISSNDINWEAMRQVRNIKEKKKKRAKKKKYEERNLLSKITRIIFI